MVHNIGSYFISTETKMTETSKELKAEAERVSKLKEGQHKEMCSNSQATANIEFSSRYVCLSVPMSILLISHHPRAC